MTAGGDRLDYPDDPSSPAVSILNTKIHINSTISDAKKGARYMTMDIKKIYLGTPMEFFQYIRVPQRFIPSEIKKHTTSSSKSIDIPILKPEKRCTV